jgi:YARHG domain
VTERLGGHDTDDQLVLGWHLDRQVARLCAPENGHHVMRAGAAIGKERGYCFKTPRAISVFGNAGCRYDDEYAVPLSVPDRNLIAVIRQAERQLHCSL